MNKTIVWSGHKLKLPTGAEAILHNVPEGCTLETRDGNMEDLYATFTVGEVRFGLHFHPDPDIPSILQVTPLDREEVFKLYVRSAKIPFSVSAAVPREFRITIGVDSDLRVLAIHW